MVTFKFQQFIGSRYRPIQRYRQLFTTYRLATIHLLQLKDDWETTYDTQGSTVGYSKGNKIITVDFHDSREILFLNHISMQMCFIFWLLFIFNSFTKKMPGGEMDALALLYFAKI